MTVRIPIRKWEKVVDPVYTTYQRNPWDEPQRIRQHYAENERYSLEVVINGEILSTEVRVPAYLEYKDQAGFREHIINSMSRQIGAVIADEVRRTIA